MPLKVNPNRMELLRLRKRLAIAKRGHKLLQDKLEGLIQRFMEEVQNYRTLRELIEKEFLEFLSVGGMVYIRLSGPLWETLLQVNDGKTTVFSKLAKKMNIPVKEISVGNLYIPFYSYLETPSMMDELVERWSKLLENIIALANKERYLISLAEEIERTKRRVNALEYKLIPQIEETIKLITVKLEELERSNFFRLLRLKES
ncbi:MULTISPECIES: V-type ATP synthase subunit D [Dictyoglomus]|uniref:V-type ATPase, D subunit n=1 Tax=Dictyoglomus turgidum (strain DSM 6724 / Z-1310) TaxID=515635 RepID=B8E136_DICTD|nr:MULTISPECIES: V-type ATP synthase subunit D [Dictyoglomus]ACK42773.1 V-type ATPase, D subunit [Dictyoglomus turgidum DSM 6724]PNV79755.1 MAG: V-type ATP synthase subunit D [Dictyoglomus turgidum]HBU30832.1 V-type ATP synthase subunit D [Dictyoglomus sp.]